LGKDPYQKNSSEFNFQKSNRKPVYIFGNLNFPISKHPSARDNLVLKYPLEISKKGKLKKQGHVIKQATCSLWSSNHKIERFCLQATDNYAETRTTSQVSSKAYALLVYFCWTFWAASHTWLILSLYLHKWMSRFVLMD